MPHILHNQSQRVDFVQRYKPFFQPSANIVNELHEFSHNNRPADLLINALESLEVMDYYQDEPHRIDNLNHLISIFQEQDRKELSPWESLYTLVQTASLSKNLDHLSESENKVIVAPIHQSKGLEFSSVFIAGAVDGFIPHFKAEDMEEEKRLFYVAMTRPKENLLITGSKQYITNRGHVIEKDMTPFLGYIESDLMGTNEAPSADAKNGQLSSGLNKQPPSKKVYENKDNVDSKKNRSSVIQPNKTESAKEKKEYFSLSGIFAGIFGYIIGFGLTQEFLFGLIGGAIGYVIGHLIRD